jgi:hypothetical protein
MYIPCEASSWTLLHQNRKLSSRISLQNQLFCLCRLPAVFLLKLYMVLYKRVFCAKIEVYVVINITESMCINYRCESNGFSLKTCEIHPVKDDFKIFAMIVKRKLSRTMCTRAVSYGFYAKAIWLNRGCRAEFLYVFKCLTVSFFL